MFTDYANKDTHKNPGIMAFLRHEVPEILNKKNMRKKNSITQIEFDISMCERVIKKKIFEWQKKHDAENE